MNSNHCKFCGVAIQWAFNEKLHRIAIEPAENGDIALEVDEFGLTFVKKASDGDEKWANHARNCNGRKHGRRSH